MDEPRLLVITGLWPTPDLPTAGVFVRDRVEALHRPIVVGPDRYDQPMPLRYLRLARRALTVRGHVDGVEAHVLFPTGLIGLLAAAVRRVPLVVYAHGSDVRETARQNFVYRILARLVARRATLIITNSADTATLVRELGGTATIVSPGVDLNRFRASPRPSLRRVLYLGGSSEAKGYSVARATADTLLGPGIRLVPPSDVPALIAEHDIVLVASRVEAFGLVAAEATASGRWVVARRIGGLPAVVDDGVTGTLVDLDEDFAAAIRNVPDYDPAAIAAHAERFSLERSNAALGGLWAGLLAKRASAVARHS